MVINNPKILLANVNIFFLNQSETNDQSENCMQEFAQAMLELTECKVILRSTQSNSG